MNLKCNLIKPVGLFTVMSVVNLKPSHKKQAHTRKGLKGHTCLYVYLNMGNDIDRRQNLRLWLENTKPVWSGVRVQMISSVTHQTQLRGFPLTAQIENRLGVCLHVERRWTSPLCSSPMISTVRWEDLIRHFVLRLYISWRGWTGDELLPAGILSLPLSYITPVCKAAGGWMRNVFLFVLQISSYLHKTGSENILKYSELVPRLRCHVKCVFILFIIFLTLITYIF